MEPKSTEAVCHIDDDQAAFLFFYVKQGANRVDILG